MVPGPMRGGTVLRWIVAGIKVRFEVLGAEASRDVDRTDMESCRREWH